MQGYIKRRQGLPAKNHPNFRRPCISRLHYVKMDAKRVKRFLWQSASEIEEKFKIN
jgi:hypothetical protein